MQTSLTNDDSGEKSRKTALPDSGHKERRAALDLALASGEELDDESLLEAILHPNFDGPTASEIAKQLLKRFKDLSGVLNCNMQELRDVGGLTLATAASIVRVRHVSKAVTKASIRGITVFRCHQEILDYCKTILSCADREEFHALFFDRRGEFVGQCCLQRGTIDHVSVYPRELLRKLIDYNASFIVLVHNHPFGMARPSNADIAMTRDLSQLVEAVGAKVYDHIIVSAAQTFSFRDGLPASLNIQKADYLCSPQNHSR